MFVVEFKQKVVRSWDVPLRSIYKSVQTDIFFLFFVFITREEVEKEEKREYSGWSK